MHSRNERQSRFYLSGCILAVVFFLILGFLTVMLVLTTLGQERGSTVEITKVGNWHGWQVEVNPYQKWFALFPSTDGSFELKKVQLEVRPIHDPSIDAPEAKSGKQVIVNDQRNPVLLLAGLEQLRAGAIPGTNHMNRVLAPDKLIETSLYSDKYTLSSFGTPEYMEVDSEQEYSSYGVTLLLGDESQMILEDYYFYGNGPGLVWSGDLDGDGKLDLIIDCICDDRSTNLALFLSSKADEGDLVKLVARWKSEG